MTNKRHKSNHNFLHVLLLALSFLFIFAGLTLAQESPEKYGITFPISELGGCKDVAECKSYCDDPVNKSACVSFAKQKGFYKEEVVKAKREELVNKAKAELGCTSAESCKALCEQAENREKCFGFAQRNGVVKSPPSQNPEVVEKAKAALGCDSAESCKSFCSRTENRDKCTEFAKEAGLKGGKHFKGPGGCNSEETCKALCSDPNNFGLCSSYGTAVGKQFKGPGGCENEESCKSYCQQNADNCKSFGLSQGAPNSAGGGNIQPASLEDKSALCNRTPNCSWVDNNCKCNHNPQAAKEYENACKQNPESCRKFSTESREDFCKKSPEQCALIKKQGTSKLDNSATGGNKRKEADDRRKQMEEKRRQEIERRSGQQPGQGTGTFTPPPTDGTKEVLPSGPSTTTTNTYTTPPPDQTSGSTDAVRGVSGEGDWFSSFLQRLFDN